MYPTLRNALIFALLLALSGCIGEASVFEDPTIEVGDPEDEDGTRQVAYNLPIGAQVEVCNVKYGLNNRSGPSTGYMVLRVLKRGTRGSVQKRSGNWFFLDLANKHGWSYGKYLCLVSQTPSSPASPPPTPDTPPTPTPAAPHSKFDISRQGIINTAKAYVGYSYWWGGARFPSPWNAAGKDKGKCYSSTYSGHSGAHGADCSGFASKVWQLGPAMPFIQNKHPYSTYNFYNGKNHWSHISRSTAKMGDALVYRKSSGGHIVIFEKGDPWGQSWAIEARGCSWGVVRNLRSFSSSYRARKRNGV